MTHFSTRARDRGLAFKELGACESQPYINTTVTPSTQRRCKARNLEATMGEGRPTIDDEHHAYQRYPFSVPYLARQSCGKWEIPKAMQPRQPLPRQTCPDYQPSLPTLQSPLAADDPGPILSFYTSREHAWHAANRLTCTSLPSPCLPALHAAMQRRANRARPPPASLPPPTV
ncbi:hypothetical protein BDY17DRAFT_291814 [Neohortaea acidophila]|uniref:Uncharacterized protein n=1 Tax=Neohortaea acidophila TaxID=245834 RepID=A0A6A6Q2L0_9PEZI|nr:uncharacterized protein BDY17DRAFT_291814 [Neohortaea acidophila]KAF2486630.1 hypothetical protein BDY17DRAFT_291814 [Neohortaea acidophila]